MNVHLMITVCVPISFLLMERLNEEMKMEVEEGMKTFYLNASDELFNFAVSFYGCDEYKCVYGAHIIANISIQKKYVRMLQAKIVNEETPLTAV